MEKKTAKELLKENKELLILLRDFWTWADCATVHNGITERVRTALGLK